MRIVLVSKALELYTLLKQRIPLLGIYFKKIMRDVYKAFSCKDSFSSNFMIAKILFTTIMTQIRGLDK